MSSPQRRNRPRLGKAATSPDDITTDRGAGLFAFCVGAVLGAGGLALALLAHVPYLGTATAIVAVGLMLLGITMWRPGKPHLTIAQERETVPLGGKGMTVLWLAMVLLFFLSVMVFIREEPITGLVGMAFWGLVAGVTALDLLDNARRWARDRRDRARGPVWEQPTPAPEPERTPELTDDIQDPITLDSEPEPQPRHEPAAPRTTYPAYPPSVAAVPGTSVTGMRRPVLLYDPDCGFCTRTGQWARRIGIRADVVAIGAPGTESLGVDLVRAEREIPYVHTDGRVSYGAAAVLGALARCPFPLSLLSWLASPHLFRPVLNRLYGLVAANRHRLPGGTPACSLEDAPPRTVSFPRQPNG